MPFFGPKKKNEPIADGQWRPPPDDGETPRKDCSTCGGTGVDPEGDYCEDC